MRNPYELLAKFLNPQLSDELKGELLRDAQSGHMDWALLKKQANSHLIAPLWYVNLKRNDILKDLPPEFVGNLKKLHTANRDRNIIFVVTLMELLTLCQEEGLEPVLLKGAASFTDDLYGDIGARMLADLDILLPPDEAIVFRDVLMSAGYQVIGPNNSFVNNDFPTIHHHHLKLLRKPGSPVVVEIHYRISRGKVGEMLNEAVTVPAKLSGMDCRILSPEWRELHNLMHSMVNDGGTIRTLVSLKAAAESAWLLARYPDADYASMEIVADGFGYGEDYRLYRAVLGELELWPDEANKPIKVSMKRVKRCIEHGGAQKGEDKTFWLNCYLSFYKKLHSLCWAWNYICYMDSRCSTWERLKKLGSYLLRPASWKKV